jgi:hypothetical protein
LALAIKVLERREFSGHRVHDLHGLDADADDLADEADDVFLIVGVVGVALDAAGYRSESLLNW